MSSAPSNPLLESILWVFKTAQQITWNDAVDLVLHAPQHYEYWWKNLLRESPQHVLIETSLILFIFWLLFIRKTVDPKKTSQPSKLTPSEIQWLIDSWTPEPLVSTPAFAKDTFMLDDMKTIDGFQGDYVVVRGVPNPVILAASYDFLSLGKDPALKDTARTALEKYGCGSCGPRGFYGTIDQHLFLEEALAKFMGAQEAICYSDGASAVTSAISAFAKKGDLLLVDEACGEPVMSGANLSRSTVRYFRHNDMNHLQQLLEAIAAEDAKLKRDTSQQRRFIVTEGIFHNTGNICPLPDIMKLKEKYFYRLFLDETLSFGTLGKTGRGVTEHFGIKTSDVEIITFSTDTVLASVGGVCVGVKEIVDHQRLSGAGYCYSASTAPFLCAAAVHSLRRLESEGVRLISSLHQNSQNLYKQLNEIDGIMLVTNAASPVMHIAFSHSDEDVSVESSKIKNLARVFLENGLMVATSSFKLLKVATASSGSLFRPSLMLCVNATWDSSMVSRIVQIIRKSVVC